MEHFIDSFEYMTTSYLGFKKKRGGGDCPSSKLKKGGSERGCVVASGYC